MNWISVEDRMPSKKNKEVLTFELMPKMNKKTNSFNKKRTIPIICLEEVKSLHKDENGVWSDGGGEHITHWMPLPDAPVKE